MRALDRYLCVRDLCRIEMDIRETVSGIIGSACLVYTGLPFDTVKVRLQTRGAEYGHSIVRCGTTMVRRESARSLWKGALPALSSGGIENAVLFTANGFFGRLFSAGDVDSLSLAQHAAIGGLSGVFSATAICPGALREVKRTVAVSIRFLLMISVLWALGNTTGIGSGGHQV